jgi:hypothetical protein
MTVRREERKEIYFKGQRARTPNVGAIGV